MQEIEIIKKAKLGDSESLEIIIKKYKPLVISLARQYYLTGGSLEDLIQEGNLGLFKAIIDYNENKNASFFTFSYNCIKRQLQMAIRKANKPNNKLLDDFVELDAETEDQYGMSIKDISPTPEAIMITKEIFEEVKNEIELKLSSLEKSILHHFLQGESYHDIATKLNITTKSVDNGLNRIRKKLKHLKE